MTIRNRALLETSEARRLALDLADTGLAAIDTQAAIKNSVLITDNLLTVAEQKIDLSQIARILVVAIGKCALDASVALEEILGQRISAGISLDVRTDPLCSLRQIRCFVGDHPYPSQRNVDATQEIIKLFGGVEERDLVISVISGGGSTLLCHPQNSTCENETLMVEAMFKAGAKIQELNLLRKHLSLARGGYLAKYAYPAQMINLIFSDVPGDNLATIASGPTVLDTTTVADAWAVAERYQLPLSRDFLIETPKEEKYFTRVSNQLVVSNQLALTAMAERARLLGYAATIQTTELSGEVRPVAERLVAELRQAPPRSVYLYGGETSVNISGHGTGGRNQQLALTTLPLLDETELILPLASDGYDNTDAAGAIADSLTRQHAVDKSLAMETFLADNDSYNFFQATGDQVLTGKTGSNVSDLIITVKI